jgi:hypothetical protein
MIKQPWVFLWTKIKQALTCLDELKIEGGKMENRKVVCRDGLIGHGDRGKSSTLVNHPKLKSISRNQ